GRRAVIPYRVAFIVAIFVGTVFALEPLWLLADILNGLMALPNLIGLLLLSGIVARESLAYYYGDRGEE
ncbi:MAG TPA: alanine:cation symporter family protein, partial [Rubrobacter sp.]|nr:alanine:cation symporter family protein [Rubrobacter sp.]